MTPPTAAAAQLAARIADRTATVAVMGLGYVGLPLAVEFSKHFDTVGFDISEARVHLCHCELLRVAFEPPQRLPAEAAAGAAEPPPSRPLRMQFGVLFICCAMYVASPFLL